jgi:DNA-binding winged helix-turn-helix (wHTH) protein
VTRFGSCEFDPNTGRLRRNGQPRNLQVQPARLLALLIDHAGEVVSRDQIRLALWPDTTVAYDQNINFAIRQIRIALGDDAQFVQTLPRRGYRFTGSIATLDVAPDRRWRKMLVQAAMLGALAAAFGSGLVVRDRPARQFLYDHLVHPNRCPYVRTLLPFHRNS